MATILEGVYRAGRIELTTPLTGVADETPVRVILADAVNSRSVLVSKEWVAGVKAWLAPFAADWDSPEMAAYDDYDANLARLRASEK